MKISVSTTLPAGTCAEINISEIKDFSEIKEWFVKWDAFHYTLDGEKWMKIELDSYVTEEAIDWKLPISVEVRDPKTCEVLATDRE